MMKQIKVWIDRGNGNGWELLHEGPERIRVELDPKDKEASQIECYLFNPQYRDEAELSLPRLELPA